MTSTNNSLSQPPIKSPPQSSNQKTSIEDRQFTFKIIKRRSPWNKNEDQAIIELVAKHGTGNWTIIANEMASNYNFKNRSGKQCRERWHNHLDPNVNKDYWSEKEENILFNKHMEFGNKWSDIAKFLPGRTDNAIKNHFYSKLRKYIRKILKQINKENLMKLNGIDSNKYNSDKIYKMLKKFKIDYKSLNKETVLNLIISNEKNVKGNKADIQLLKNKTRRTKNLNHFIKNTPNSYLSLSTQGLNNNTTNTTTNSSNNNIKKINLNTNFTTVHFRNSKSKSKNINDSTINNSSSTIAKHHSSQIYPNFITKSSKKRKRTKRRKVSICLSTPENKKSQISKILPSRKFGYGNTKGKRRTHNLSPSDFLPTENDNEIVRPGFEIYNKTNIILDKSLVFPPSPKRVPPSININIINATSNTFPIINNINQTYPTSRSRRPPGLPELTLSFTEPLSTNHNQTPHYINFPNDDKQLFSYFENQPQCSPMNINNMTLYPQSTRNLFNIDLPIYDGPVFKNGNNYIIPTPTPKQGNIPSFMPTPNNNRDYLLQNKMLINEMKSKISYTYDHLNNENSYGNENISISNNGNGFIGNNFYTSDKSQPNKKRPQIDLSIVNQSETNTLFMDSLGTTKNNHTYTTNIFNLSPVSAFAPGKQSEK